jgi:hypothetical protein
VVKKKIADKQRNLEQPALSPLWCYNFINGLSQTIPDSTLQPWLRLSRVCYSCRWYRPQERDD